MRQARESELEVERGHLFRTSVARLHLRRARRAALLPVVQLRDHFLFSDRHFGAASKWPVRAVADGTNRYAPFFVLGSPRSGTTLLRAILCAHPDVFIPPENGTFRFMIRVFGSLRTAEWMRAVEAVLDRFSRGYEFDHWGIDIDSVKRSAEALAPEERSLAALISLIYLEYGASHAPGRRCWGDKSTPGDFQYLYKVDLVFPKARYVHIVRDGRDCVASSVRAGFFDESYYRAAYAWRDNVRFCRRFGRRAAAEGRFFQLRYEDLVSSPKKEVERMCQFLALEPAGSMLEHHNLVGKTAPDVGEIEHHENVRRPISKSSLGKWRSQLPGSELDAVSRIVAPELRSYGYSME